MAFTTIDDPSAHFQTALYTGTDSSNAITNDGNSDLQPDLLWIKRRDYNNGHQLLDSSRGVNKIIGSESTGGETTLAGRLSSFDSDGFTVTSTSGAYNASGEPFVGWQWKANGGTTTAVSASGAMNAGTHQANTTAGFSIVTYTGEDNVGDTVTHGLGAVPHFMVVKVLGQGGHWGVYHHRMVLGTYAIENRDPEDYRLLLSAANDPGDFDNFWSDTAPTSSVFTVGTNGDTGDATTYVAYLWTSIQGYSRFGSFEGNNNAEGPFVYTGFKPAWVLWKDVDDANDNWYLYDNKRNVYNAQRNYLSPTSANAEGSNGGLMDFLSNGFKVRNTGGDMNNDGNTYVYAAFAEQPFVTSGGAPATAR